MQRKCIFCICQESHLNYFGWILALFLVWKCGCLNFSPANNPPMFLPASKPQHLLEHSWGWGVAWACAGCVPWSPGVHNGARTPPFSVKAYHTSQPCQFPYGYVSTPSHLCPCRNSLRWQHSKHLYFPSSQFSTSPTKLCYLWRKWILGPFTIRLMCPFMERLTNKQVKAVDRNWPSFSSGFCWSACKYLIIMDPKYRL